MAGPTEAQCPEPGANLAHGTQFTLVELYIRCEILPHTEGTSLELIFPHRKFNVRFQVNRNLTLPLEIIYTNLVIQIILNTKIISLVKTREAYLKPTFVR